MTRPQKLRDVQQVLHKNSWVLVRQTGSHQTWVHCTCNAPDREWHLLELEIDTDDDTIEFSKISPIRSPARSPVRANSVRHAPYSGAEYPDASSAASSCSSASSSDSEEAEETEQGEGEAEGEEWFGSRRALERRKTISVVQAKSVYASIPRTASHKERRRPQLKLDTYVEHEDSIASLTPRAGSPLKFPVKGSPLKSPLKSPTKALQSPSKAASKTETAG